MRRVHVGMGLGVALAGLAFAGLAFGPCVEQKSLENGLASFRVIVTGVSGVTSGLGTLQAPYALPNGEIEITLDAEALDQHSARFEEFSGDVGVTIAPGDLVDPNQRVTFAQGKAEGVKIKARRVFGRFSVWLEDLTWVADDPAQGALRSVEQRLPQGSFAMGVSNPVIFADPSLRQVQWDQWTRKNDTGPLDGKFVEIDCRAGSAQGPFPDGFGQLVVTGIVNEGFFVSDPLDQALGFNHLYVFTFSRPENLEVGDRIDQLAGGDGEFSGCTQISFPIWKRSGVLDEEAQKLRVLNVDALFPPVLLTDSMCTEDGGITSHLCGYSKNVFTLEKLESARVRLERVKTPDVHIDCDFNADLQIPALLDEGDEIGSLEYKCRDACLIRDGKGTIKARRVIAKPEVLRSMAVSTCTQNSECASGQCGGSTPQEAGDGICRVACPWESDLGDIKPACLEVRVKAPLVCSELMTLDQFSQWTVAQNSGTGSLVNVITREALPNFNPRNPENTGLVLDYLQGNLRQVRAARPRWIVLVGAGANDVPENLRSGQPQAAH